MAFEILSPVLLLPDGRCIASASASRALFKFEIVEMVIVEMVHERWALFISIRHQLNAFGPRD